MKTKSIIFVATLGAMLLLTGCGQSGALYLSSPSDASTTSGIQQHHESTHENNAPSSSVSSTHATQPDAT